MLPHFDPRIAFSTVYNAIKQAITRTGPSITEDQFDVVWQKLGEQMEQDLAEAGFFAESAKISKDIPPSADSVSEVASTCLSDSDSSDLESVASDPFSHPDTEALRTENEALRKENLALKAENARLRAGNTDEASDSVRETKESVLKDRNLIIKQMHENERQQEKAQKTHETMIERAQDPKAIQEKMKTLGPKARTLVAKKALQDEATDYEEKTIMPLSQTYKELRAQLTDTSLRMIKVTPAGTITLKTFVPEFKAFLELPENKTIKDQIKEAINPQAGMHPRKLKDLLAPPLMKFIGSKKPDWMSQDEWVTYVTSADNEDSKKLLRHQGIVIDELLTKTEQALSIDWKEKRKGFRLPR